MDNHKDNSEAILPFLSNWSGLSWILSPVWQHNVELLGELGEGHRGAIKSTQSWANTICKERITDMELFIKNKKRFGDPMIMTFDIIQNSAQNIVTHYCPYLLGKQPQMLNLHMGTSKQK